MKRLLIFSLVYYPDFVGGAEVAVKEITDRIDPKKFEFHMVTLGKNSLSYEKIGNVHVHRVNIFSKNLFPFLAFFRALQLNSQYRYDATWSIMANWAGFAALFFKITHPRIPFLLTLQEGDPIAYIKRKVRFVYPLFKRIFWRADSIQAISNYLGNFAREMGFDGPLSVIPNGVDLSLFTASVEEEKLKFLRKKLQTREDERFLISASRLVVKNGLADLISSLVYLPENISCLILGIGPEEENLKKMVTERKLEGRVKFLGFIPQEEIPAYLKISEIFIRPSLSEGLGNSFLEAMAAEVPVIATRVGGIPDFLFEGETGLFCQINTPRDIAEKVRILLSDEDLRAKIISGAKKLVMEKYDWRLIANQMEKKVFDQLFLPKVLIATGLYPPDIGGPATYSKLLFEELPKHHFNGKVISYSSVRHLPKGLSHLFYFFKVLRAAKTAKVIYAQDPVSVGLPAVLAARLSGRPFLLKIVGDYAWEQAKQRFGLEESLEGFSQKKTGYSVGVNLLKKIQMYVAGRAKVVIVPSQYLKKIISNWGILPDKIKVIYNAFEGVGNVSKVKLSGRTIVSAGRLVPWKGFSALINIMPELIKIFPDLSLLIIGDGPERQNLQNEIDRSGMTERVKLLGRLEHQKLSSYISSANIFVLNTAYEGLSHQLIEVLALGIPIVTTNVGGNVELITDHKDGILVEYNNETALREAVKRILTDPTYADFLVKNGLDKVKQFNKERMLDQLTTEISKL